MNNQSYEELINRFFTWGSDSNDIRGILIVGSRARTKCPADEYSDLDLLFITTSPSRYIKTISWIHNMGEYWITFIEKTATGGGLERRILFEGGFDVDVSVFTKQQIQNLLLESSSLTILQRGYKIVLDKDGVFDSLQSLDLSEQPTKSPLKEQYDNECNDFWYHAVLAAKKILRGECWDSIMIVDNYMKKKLLTMIEWYSTTSEGKPVDTWHGGRFLDTWADNAIVNQLKNCFAKYQLQDIQQALYSTMNLYRELSQKVAVHYGFVYPTVADEMATKWIQSHLIQSNTKII